MGSSSVKPLETYDKAVETIEKCKIESFSAIVMKFGMRVEIGALPQPEDSDSESEEPKMKYFKFDFYRHWSQERTVEVHVFQDGAKIVTLKNPREHGKTTIEYVIDLINHFFIVKEMHVVHLCFEFMTDTYWFQAQNNKLEKRMEDFMTKLIEKLKQAERTKKIIAGTLEINQGQGENQDVLRILPFLMPEVLQSIKIPNFVNEPATSFGRICNEDAWKMARNLEIGTKPGTVIEFPVDFFHHFETFSISLPPFDWSNLDILVNSLVKKDRFKEATIVTKGAKQAFDDNKYIETDAGMYDLPQDTNPIMKAEVTADTVVITRNKKPAEQPSPQTSSEGSDA